MAHLSRRELLEGVSGGALLAGLAGLGFGRERAWLEALGEDALDFGELEPLVALLQESEPDALVETLVERWRAGLDLDSIVAAGALANARTFGGEDYTGYHCAMAMVPAHEMAQQLPAELAPLPVLKVLHRNARRTQEFGGRDEEVLRPVRTPSEPVDAAGLHAALLDNDVDALERKFATFADRPGQMYEALQAVVHDDADVHRVVLAWRAWDFTRFTGQEHAHTLLRQSLRYCASWEAMRQSRGHAESTLRELLPRLLEQYRLTDGATGNRAVDERWIDELAQTVFRDQREAAAEAVAGSLAAGFEPQAIGEALSLASTRLLLHDRGRPQQAATDGKPEHSVHGASIGVHASDAAWAWRQLATVTGPRNSAASLIAGAYHTAGQSFDVGGEPYAYQEAMEAVESDEPAALLVQLSEAIAAGDQRLAGATASAYAAAGGEQDSFFRVLLQNAVEEDGALHAEKYFRTAQEVCSRARAGFVREHMIAAARVSASQAGHKAPGLDLARERLAG